MHLQYSISIVVQYSKYSQLDKTVWWNVKHRSTIHTSTPIEGERMWHIFQNKNYFVDIL